MNTSEKFKYVKFAVTCKRNMILFEKYISVILNFRYYSTKIRKTLNFCFALNGIYQLTLLLDPNVS